MKRAALLLAGLYGAGLAAALLWGPAPLAAALCAAAGLASAGGLVVHVLVAIEASFERGDADRQLRRLD